jgi:multiple sugar transport system ATP-binding protein
VARIEPKVKPDEGLLDFQAPRLNNEDVARVVIEHLTKVFTGPGGESIRALDNASLAVGDKELLVLVGPSGCGKTTTLRLVAGLEVPTSGSISIDGQVANNVPPKQREVAMVFQNPALYPHLSAYDNMAFGLRLRKCPPAEIERRVREAAQMLGLTDCLARLPMALSGGQRQRVAVGRALVRRPKVFLFDEPLSNLDAPMRQQMRAEIARLHARLEAAMIYVTHDQLEAMTLGDRVAVLKAGVIQQVAKPLELYRQPANLFVAGFIGSPPMNFLEGTLVPRDAGLWFEAQGDQPAPGFSGPTIPLPPGLGERLVQFTGKPVVFGLRPEHVLLPPVQPDTPADWMMEAIVEAVEVLGAETCLHLAVGGRSLVARVVGTSHSGAREKMKISLDLSQAHWFDAASGKAIV